MHLRKTTWAALFALLALVVSCADDGPASSAPSNVERGTEVSGGNEGSEQSIALFDVALSEEGGASIVTGLVGDTSVSLRVAEVRSLDGSELVPTLGTASVREKRQPNDEDTTRTTCDCWECGTKKKPKQCCICTP